MSRRILGRLTAVARREPDFTRHARKAVAFDWIQHQKDCALCGPLSLEDFKARGRWYMVAPPCEIGTALHEKWMRLWRHREPVHAA